MAYSESPDPGVVQKDRWRHRLSLYFHPLDPEDQIMDEETTVKDIKTKLKSLNKVEVGKKVARFVTSHSVGIVVSRAVGANVPAKNGYQKAQRIIAGVALGGIVSEYAGRWSDEQIVDLLKMVDEVQKARNGEE
jgi:hypothetical protein